MNEQTERAYGAWAKFLNPASLRNNLVAASIFLAAYEILRSSVIDRIRNFHTRDFDDNGPILSENYASKVLALDRSPLRASLLWLREMLAIEDADIARVDAIREHRNELAHDLPRFIATIEADINIKLLESIYCLVTKIDRWWIREVDIPSDPAYDGRTVADEAIQSGNMLFIELMIHVATGKDSSVPWEGFQAELAKVFADSKRDA